MRGRSLILVRFFGASLFVALLFFSAAPACAQIGVGVDTGKVVLNDQVRGDVAYALPQMTVSNTGDQTAMYAMEVTFNETQPQRKPQASWVKFTPETFTLAPQQSQVVTMQLQLPNDVDGGEYFAYLEAHTVASQDGGAQVNTAAAAKFLFNVDAPKVVLAQPGATQVAQLVVSYEWLLAPLTMLQAGVLVRGARGA